MFFSLSFLLIFLFSSNNVANAHETHLHPHTHLEDIQPRGGESNQNQTAPTKIRRHVDHDHGVLGHHAPPTTTTAPPTTTTPGADEEGCDLNPCLPQCNTCQRDGICSLSCKSEYGYVCVSPTGSLGKNTSFAPPIIDCKLHAIDVSIVDGFFLQTDWTGHHFYISTKLDREKCKVERKPAGGIGTWSTFFINTRTQSHCMEKFVNEGDVQYSSTLWSDLQGNGFDMPVPIIKFRCEYRTDYYIGTEMKPMIAQTTTIVEDGNRLDLKIELCKQSTCSGDCPAALQVNGQAIYTIGQRIYVGIKSIGHENTVVHGHTMALQDVYLSCSTNAESPSRRIQMFEDGCIESGVSSLFARPGDLKVHRACFSFILARLLDCKDKFYIHAYVSLCNRANRQCFDGTMTCPAARGKRSAAQDESGPLVIGPVYMVDSERVAQPSFWVLPSGQAPGDAMEDQGETITLRASRLSSENSDSQFGAIEVKKQEDVGSSSIDVILIVGISLLVFSLLLFSFSFYQFRSRYSSIVDDLKK